MIQLDFLELVEVFRDLNDDQLLAVRDCCGEAKYRRGDTIFSVNEEPLFLWAVIDGEVTLAQETPGRARPEKDPIATLSTTMTFGWSSLVPPFKYMLSATCTSIRCRLLKVDRECLKKLFEEDLELAYLAMLRIASLVGSRFHQLREEIIKKRGQDIMNRW